MKIETYWTIYNEIDDRIYDGTPIFDNERDAVEFVMRQPRGYIRPSDVVKKISITIQ